MSDYPLNHWFLNSRGQTEVQKGGGRSRLPRRAGTLSFLGNGGIMKGFGRRIWE